MKRAEVEKAYAAYREARAKFESSTSCQVELIDRDGGLWEPGTRVRGGLLIRWAAFVGPAGTGVNIEAEDAAATPPQAMHLAEASGPQLRRFAEIYEAVQAWKRNESPWPLARKSTK